MGFWKSIKQLRDFDNNISLRKSELSKLSSEIRSEEAKKNSLKQEIDVLSKNRDSQIKETELRCQRVIEKYREDTEKNRDANDAALAQMQEAKAELEKLETKLSLLRDNLKTYRSVIKRIEGALDSDMYPTFRPDLGDELERLDATVELHLHTHDIKYLNSLAKENNKIINKTLERYEKRYTTKTNRALYELMVIALRAELQNILVDLKFSTLEKAKIKFKKMIEKYVGIASEGNQSIAPTLRSFIAEIEVLFEKAIEIEYEYFVKKEKEREEQQAIRAQMRQEAEERKELEKAREHIEKEEQKYIQEISKITDQLHKCCDTQKKIEIERRLDKLQSQLKEVEDKKEDILSRQNGKAGTVYIISNLGSFGENTFKIGMTRRLEPMDRVRELGDASVPFAYDVHSFIFSEDAVGLEREMHKRLYGKRKNKINLRKEFFDVSINELEELVMEIDSTAEFNKTMLACEYRQGLETNLA